jgi:hypothetical protein
MILRCLQLDLINRSDECNVSGTYSSLFSMSFSYFICKKHVLSVLHVTVTLRMMSNSCRSVPMINAHLPIDEPGRGYYSDRREFEIMAVAWQQATSSLSWSSKK